MEAKSEPNKSQITEVDNLLYFQSNDHLSVVQLFTEEC